MTHTPPPDDDLRRWLGDAAEAVDPADRLTAIRARTRSARSRRRGWYAVTAAGLATAGVVAAVAITNTVGQPTPDTGGPAATGSPTVGDETPATRTEALYFIGDTPSGPKLFREFQRFPADAGLSDVLTQLSSPADPDYRTSWPAGTVTSAEYADGDVIRVTTADADADLLARQQLVYTAQAFAGARMVVDLADGSGATYAPRQSARKRTLSPISISDPSEGAQLETRLIARGVADSFEANVLWEIRSGDEVVKSGFATATGFGGRLYPWEKTIDVGGLAPGEYTFVAMTDDPSGGAEGPGVVSDTRTVIVR